MAEGFSPPTAVRQAALRGLRLRQQWKRGGLSSQEAGAQGIGSGVQRAADLSNGRNISLDTIRQMRAFFARHAKNYRPDKKETDGGPTAGTIAWLLWGGNAGKVWADAVLGQAEAKREKQQFSLSSTQVDADEGIRRRVQILQRIFDPADLAEDGLETEPHITLFYGLDPSVTAEQVAQIASRFSPFEVRFTGVSLFERPEFDVVKVDVEGGDLRELNAQLRALPNQNERIVYQPHLTLAYVRAGSGSKYLIDPLRGQTMRVNAITFSNRDGEKTLIPLGGVMMKEEKPSKLVGGQRLPASAFLVVEDPKTPDTWHLPVRDANGSLDPGRMGAARAALTVGYRGNVYKGPQKQLALAKLTRLYAELEKKREGETQKGALAVFKQADGRYRWVTFSSNAFRDRDREIVSTKALADDVERADRDGRYGPLRFWHMPGVDLGDCDYNWLRGRTLIESGTFRDPFIGEKVAQKQGQFQISIGFLHPRSEPDEYGVFHTIRRFERSLVPAGRAANPFTSLSVVTKEQSMNDTVKQQALKALLDGDVPRVQQLLNQADTAEKTADAMGIAFKDIDLNTLSADALLDAAIARKEAEMKAAEKQGGGENEDGKQEDGMGRYVAELKGCVNRMGDYMTRMEKMFGERQKDDKLASVQEATDSHSARIAQLEQTIKDTAQQLKDAQAALKSLQSDVPPGLTEGKRPTQSDDNVLEDAEVKRQVKEGVNGAQTYLNGFLDYVHGEVGRGA